MEPEPTPPNVLETGSNFNQVFENRIFNPFKGLENRTSILVSSEFVF